MSESVSALLLELASVSAQEWESGQELKSASVTATDLVPASGLVKETAQVSARAKARAPVSAKVLESRSASGPESDRALTLESVPV